jgi:hypothetical protein
VVRVIRRDGLAISVSTLVFLGVVWSKRSAAPRVHPLVEPEPLVVDLEPPARAIAALSGFAHTCSTRAMAQVLFDGIASIRLSRVLSLNR